MMRIVVPGGAGFIGRHLVPELVRRGHHVIVTGRSPRPTHDLPDGAIYVQGSIGDAGFLAGVLQGADAVAHLAHSTVPSTADRAPVMDVQENLVGTLTLLSAMAAAGAQKLIYLSSGGTVYGPTSIVPTPETHRLSPTGSYGIIKAAIERYIDMQVRQSGLRAVVIRASNPYGPSQTKVGVQGIIGTFLAQARAGMPLTVWGDGSAVRDFLHVGDLCRLIADALERDVVGVFNAGSGTGTTVRDVAERVLAVTGARAGITYMPGRPNDVPVSILDCRRASAAFGWTATTPLGEGIAATWRSMGAVPAEVSRRATG